LTPATVLRGPRQVGKTTLLEQVLVELLDRGIDPRRIFYVPFDYLPELKPLTEPVLELSRWYAQETLGKTLNQAAHDGQQAFILFDELQNIDAWSPQLKFLVDQNPVRVLVTGSSALRIEAGQDSLAGRITTMEIGPLLLREIAEFRGLGALQPFSQHNGLDALRSKQFWLDLRRFGGETHRQYRDEAFRTFADRGAFPVAHTDLSQPWENLAETLNETVIRRAIRHDLRRGSRGKKRDEGLLEEVFRLACVYAGQAPSQAFYMSDLLSSQWAGLSWQRVQTYLRYLDDTLLVRLINPLELRLKKNRGAAKLCLCDHVLRASWLREVIPLTPSGLQADPNMTDLAGHIAESVVGAFFRSIIGLGLHHFPARGAEWEVDYVLTVGNQHIPIEVKYRRRIDHQDSRGLRAFMEKSHYNAPFSLMITLLDEPASEDPRIISLPLSTMLLMR